MANMENLTRATDILLAQDDKRREKKDPTTLGVKKTDYATQWRCSWSNPEHGIWSDQDLELLAHVNCSYLSCGKPPTLLALKQHAQSLTNLIRKLSVSPTFGIIDAEKDKRLPAFMKSEAFDWLDDLDVPYENQDDLHQVPLYAIQNHVKYEYEYGHGNKIQNHCPLKQVPDSSFFTVPEEEPTRRPYQTHSTLLQHANECLEILDHDYNSTGGIMSILPSGSEHDRKQLEGANNTIIGQLLLHHQHLVARMHELEINYANALDALAGEAAVPHQMLTAIGPDGRAKGRNVAYPQDRYVLVNAGDDTFNHVHEQLNQVEADMENREYEWRDSGAMGDRLWIREGEKDTIAKGLVAVDVPTRYYRLKGYGPKSTLFVIPAWETHPGVSQTRKIEVQPTILTVQRPDFPKRASILQSTYDKRVADGQKATEMKNLLVEEREERAKALSKAQSKLRKVTKENDKRGKVLEDVFTRVRSARQLLPDNYQLHLDAVVRVLERELKPKEREEDVMMSEEV